MAQRVLVQLVDDLDGSEAEQTVTFALDGVSYEIDLSTDNAAKFRDAFEQWTRAGRRIGGRTRSGGSSATTRVRSRSGSPDSVAMREWAKAQGMEVSERGRIPASVRAAYTAAH